MSLSTAEIYRQKESSSLTQTAKFIFSSLTNCEIFELGVLLKDIKTGKTPSKNEKKYYEDEFIDWFKPNEIGDRKYLEKAECKLSKFAYDSGQVTVYKKNSILINAIGDVGRIAILNHEASSNQQITGIELNEEKLLTEYCYYYLLANRHHFYKDLFQTTLPIVNQKKIKMIPVPVPELNEQKRIVAFLNKLENIDNLEELKRINGFDDFIEIANKFYILKKKNGEISSELTHQLSLVKQLRQAFLREAMQGKLVEQNEADEPATELLAKIKAEKEKLIKDPPAARLPDGQGRAGKKIKKQKPLPPISEDEIPFEIPENWVWCRLGDICEKIGSGSTPKGSNYSDSGFPFFRSQNIRNNGLVYNDIKYVSDEVQKKMNGTAVYPNDILLNIILIELQTRKSSGGVLDTSIIF
jgi:type I restriction enzyme S subunit